MAVEPSGGGARPDPAAARKRSRAMVMAVLLGGFVVLLYAITIAKMTLSVQ